MKHIHTFESFLNEGNVSEAIKKLNNGGREGWQLNPIKVSGYKIHPILRKQPDNTWSISMEVADSRGFYIGPIELSGISDIKANIDGRNMVNKTGKTIDTMKLSWGLDAQIAKIQF